MESEGTSTSTDKHAIVDAAVTRRAMLLGSSAALTAMTQPAYGDMVATPSTMQGGALSLAERMDSHGVFPTTYGVEARDVYYPRWFLGTWLSDSTTESVEAPAGITLFGGNRTFQTAQADVGKTLQYESRFRLAGGGGGGTALVVADREFNVASIVRASMGNGAVLEVQSGVRRAARSKSGDRPTPLGSGFEDNEAAAERIVFVVAPAGSNGTRFRADLATFQRHSEVPGASSRGGSEAPGDAAFDVLEVVRQVVTTERSSAAVPGASAAGPAGQRPPLIKDIETITTYRRKDGDVIEATQRTATYLSPSNNGDPYLAAAVLRLGGRAVDVRTYKVIYKRTRSPKA